MFQISVTDLSWIQDNPDDPDDLCAHGFVTAKIGDETFDYDATVSAAALYLLKSLTEDHIIYEEEQMLPCCGFSMYARDQGLDTVDIIGCSGGIDWSVLHEGDCVKIVTSSGKETVIPLLEYRREVYAFADKIEAFYDRCTPKIMPADKVDRDGYTAFWNEWHRRRK